MKTYTKIDALNFDKFMAIHQISVDTTAGVVLHKIATCMIDLTHNYNNAILYIDHLLECSYMYKF